MTKESAPECRKYKPLDLDETLRIDGQYISDLLYSVDSIIPFSVISILWGPIRPFLHFGLHTSDTIVKPKPKKNKAKIHIKKSPTTDSVS